jgi:GNAT superfamily N-acetyltransferase
MDPQIRWIEDRKEASEMSPALEAYVAQATADVRDGPLPEGTCRRFFERRFADKETVLLVAETRPGRADLGVCITGPFEDPLVGTRVPMILVLFVSPSARHRGLARALVGRATEVLTSRGITTLAARAGHNDDALISMGERWGFVRQWEIMLRD